MEAYQRYGPALLRKARRMLNNEADAADLVQALFVQLWERGDQRLDLPFLYRALTNRCLNLLRDEQNRARLLAREEPTLRGAPRLLQDDQALSLQLLLHLSNLVSPEVFETLVFRFLDEMGQEEIAEVMQVSRKTVQNRLDKAKSAILTLRAQESL